MCMLSFIPAGIQPNEKELWHGSIANPDGHGWAIVNARTRQLTIRRTMNPDEALETFMKERERNESGPAMFHSRIATSGRVDVTGVHPFHVGSDKRTVLGHNGILFHPRGDKSDTRVFAELILPRMGSLDKGRTIRQIGKITGKSNKLVILTVNPLRRQHAYIIGEDLGYWSAESGVWHSNGGYMGFARNYGYKTYSAGSLWSPDGGLTCDEDDETEWADEDMQPWGCEVCGNFNCVPRRTNVCIECESCQDCYMSPTACMCYTPKAITASNSAFGLLNGSTNS